MAYLHVFSPAERAVQICPIFHLVTILVFRKAHACIIFGKMKIKSTTFSLPIPLMKQIPPLPALPFPLLLFLLHFCLLLPHLLSFIFQTKCHYVKFLAQCLAHNCSLVKHLTPFLSQGYGMPQASENVK